MQNNIILPAQWLSKTGEMIDNNYKLVDETGAIPSGNVLLNVAQLPLLNLISGKRGVLVSGAMVAEPVDLPLSQLDMIAIHFDSFVDGRGYSFATLLRRQGFCGELYAVGDVFQDVLFYLKRVGFDAFALKQDKECIDAIGGLNDFSRVYQVSTSNSTQHFQVGNVNCDA